MTALTWSLLEHSWSLSIVRVTRLHGLRRLCLLMMKVAALGPEPKRHNNLMAGQRRVPPRTLKLWRAWIFMSWSVARRTLPMSEMRV